MRWSAIVCLLCVTALSWAPEARARGGTGQSAVTQHLLEKGFAALRRAELAYFRSDRQEARRHAQQAERLFLDVLAQDPSEVRAALLGGQAATFSGDIKSALKWVERLRRISRLGENDPDLHYLTAFVQILGEKRPVRGLRALHRMYALNPRARPVERDHLWYMALLDHGRNQLSANQPEDALATFRTGARLARRLGSRTKEMTMQGNAGAALQRGGRWIEAAELFAALVKQQPDNPVWHWQYGLAQAGQSKFAEAIPSYREVIRLRAAGRTVPSMEDELRFVDLRLANCLRNMSERQRDPRKRDALLEESEQLMRYFVEHNPDVAVGYRWLGVLIYRHKERPYEALPYFHKANELDPVCVEPLKFIVQIHENYPPPPDQMPKGDPAAAAAARQKWTAPVAAWKKSLADGEAERKKIREAREKRDGADGCM